MTPDQSVKIKPIYDKLEMDIAALRLAAKTPEEKNALNDKIRAMQADANKRIDAVLDPAQRKKVDGLMFEMMEMISVGVSPQMLHDMKLTPDQRVAILKIVADVQTKMKAVPKADYRAKYPAIMEAERVRIAPLLTPAQKAIYDKYDTGGRLIGSPRPPCAKDARASYADCFARALDARADRADRADAGKEAVKALITGPHPQTLLPNMREESEEGVRHESLMPDI